MSKIDFSQAITAEHKAARAREAAQAGIVGNGRGGLRPGSTMISAMNAVRTGSARPMQTRLAGVRSRRFRMP